MRFLPRTPLGTWLLAGVVWLPACSALWWTLPVVPRADWRLPAPGVLIGFGSGGTILSLEMRYDPRTDKVPWRSGPLRIHDTDNGRTLASFFVSGDAVDVADLSPDGRRCSVGIRRGDHLAPMLIDVAERREAGRAIGGAPKPGVASFRQYSPDGRLLAIDDHGRKDRGVVLWDAARRGERCFFPEVRLPGDFSADGRFLATLAGLGPELSLSVFECATGALRRTIAIPAPETWPPRLSDDGSAVVVAQYSDQSSRSPDVIRCWDVATGERRWERRANAVTQLHWVDGGRMIVSNESGKLDSAQLVWIDAATGKVIRHVPLGRRLFPPAPRPLDPADRRFFITTAEAKPPDTLERLATNVGLGVSSPMPVGRLLDSVTGETLAELPGAGGAWNWSSDGRQLACLGSGDRPWVRVWDVPPRKPLAWFAGGTVVFAMPPLLLAFLRVQQLRRKVAP